MRLLLLLFVCCSFGLFAQTYTHPTTGINSTYAGACMVNTCSGTYYDNGGAGGNYAANINAIYRTFCPSTAGMCVRATFTSFSMNDTYFLCGGPSSCCDYLSILNGPAQNSPALYNNCTASPGTITASSASGCLTFRHTTDGSVQLGGWAATLSCVACAGGPTSTANNDCQNAVQVCVDTPFGSASTGPGLASDGCSGCTSSGGEVYSSWYRFQVANSGTLGFIIDPTNNADDYDFALYGPGATCGALGAPIRCSYAANTGNTGMGNGAGDASEIVTGDGWTSTLAVTAGQIFYLMVNNWSPTASGFLLDWTLSGGASLNCTPLAVDLSSFECSQDEQFINVHWTTQSETNSDFFKLEKSTDGVNYVEMVRTKGQGNSSLPTDYFIVDAYPELGVNYYRLTEVDLSGMETVFNITSCEATVSDARVVAMKIYDMNGQCIWKTDDPEMDVKATLKSAMIPAGVYILETEDTNHKVKRIKFVQLDK